MSKRHLRRFFYSFQLPEKNQSFCLSAEEAHHLANVVCLQEGEDCLVIDPLGTEVEAVVVAIDNSHKVSLKVKEVCVFPESCPKDKLIVFQAIPKKAKFDWIVQKAQELGVFQLFPLMSKRTIVRIEPSKEKGKLERWHKLAIEAAKQSGAREIVRLEAPLDFNEIREKLKGASWVFLFHPSEKSEEIGEWCKSQSLQKTQGSENVASRQIAVFIGPEGGFSEEEVRALEKNAQDVGAHFKMLHLGETILKSDTAFVSIISVLKFLI